MSPSGVLTLTSPATRPSVEVTMVCAGKGSAKAAKPAPVAKPAPAPAPRPAPAPATPVNKVAKKDHKHFEGRLLEERARLLQELG